MFSFSEKLLSFVLLFFVIRLVDLGSVELEIASGRESSDLDLPCWYTGGWLATTTGLGFATTFIAGFEALIADGGGGAAFFLRPEKKNS